MSNTRYAAIDIGSNTILMVIAEQDASGKLTILADEQSIARLGEKVDLTKEIQNEALDRAVKVLENYSIICKDYDVKYISSVATSAIRDAINGNAVIEKLSSIINSQIKIISGEDEASLSFRGTIEEPLTGTVIDIGGGSTEIISGENGKIKYKKSLDRKSVV